MNAKPIKSGDYSLWSVTAAGAIRAAFGLIWAMDAYPMDVDKENLL